MLADLFQKHSPDIVFFQVSFACGLWRVPIKTWRGVGCTPHHPLHRPLAEMEPVVARMMRQETKLNEGDHAEYEEKISKLVQGYKLHWNSCSLEGSKSYSGTLAMVLDGSSGDEKKGSAKGTLHHFFAAKKEGPAPDTEHEGSGAVKTSFGGPVNVTMGLPTLGPDDGATAVEVR